MMIKLTEVLEWLGQKEPEFTTLYVPADIVVRVLNNKTIVIHQGHRYIVKESPEEVVSKVLEYHENKLSFANDPIHFFKWYNPTMKKLAGLEE